jgi:hypothetical protein
MRKNGIESDQGAAVHQETSTTRAERGLVYAFHFLPYHLDPRIEQFWSSLSERLAHQGHQLVILSTTELMDKNLLYIQVPYNLPDYRGNELSSESCPSHVSKSLENWYRCNPESAQLGWKVAEAFFKKIFSETEPAAIISWQSVNPLSRLVRNLATTLDVPWWTLERGWFPNTLMLDTAENNLMGEISRSLAVNRLLQKYQSNKSLLVMLREKWSNDNWSRYPADHSVSAEISPSQDEFAVFFNHGRPFFEDLVPSSIARFHGISDEQLVNKLSRIAAYLGKRGIKLYIKEHPITKMVGRSPLANTVPGAQDTNLPVEFLVKKSRYRLLTTSSIQFSLAINKTRFGTLSSGFLTTNVAVPHLGVATDLDHFFREISDASDWSARWESIDRQMSFLYENYMLPIDSVAALEQSCDELCGLLRPFLGAPQSNGFNFFKNFLSGNSIQGC